MFDTIIHYFDLGLYPDRPTLGISKKKRNLKKIVWTIMYYFFVAVGVFANSIMEQVEKNITITIDCKSLLVSVIIAAVIFPSVYKTAKLNPTTANPMHLFIAFQNGFFFDTIFKRLFENS